MRPSCGLRFSAMSMRDMILMREMIGPWSFLGAFSFSIAMPSIRYRMRTRFSKGSTWMSLARSLMALEMSCVTYLMTGASLASDSLPE